MADPAAGALFIAALAALSEVVWGIDLAQKTPAQPIEFPHKRHIAMGVHCLYCHPGATREASSGLPTTSKCWGCHQQLAITKTSFLLLPLVEAVKNGGGIQ